MKRMLTDKIRIYRGAVQKNDDSRTKEQEWNQTSRQSTRAQQHCMIRNTISHGLPLDLSGAQSDLLSRIVLHGPHSPKGELVHRSVAVVRFSVRAVI